MSNMEEKMDKIEFSYKEEIVRCITKIKTNIITSFQVDLNKLVDQRSMESKDKRRREVNIIGE